jgi:hypothetical protein
MMLSNKILVFMLLCSTDSTVSAAAVHSWVDHDGVTHFSDSPPALPAEGVTTLILDDDLHRTGDSSSDYYSIVNQWQRMRAERDKKTETTLARARIRADHAAALNYSDEPYQEISEPRYYPAYWFPYRQNRHSNIGYYPESNTRRDANRGPHHVQANHSRLSRSSKRSGQTRNRGGPNNADFARGNGLNFNFNIR